MAKERLTKKFGDKIILPMIPMEIKSKEDLEKYHKVRREYENNTIRLSEYEDIGSIEDFNSIKDNIKLLNNGSKQLYAEMKLLVKDKVELIELLTEAVEEIENCYGRDTELTKKIRNKLNAV